MSLEYGKRICEKYGVDFNPIRPQENDDTIIKVAKKVLPVEQLRQWLTDEGKELEALRRSLNMTPFDLHTEEVNNELAKLG